MLVKVDILTRAVLSTHFIEIRKRIFKRPYIE